MHKWGFHFSRQDCIIVLIYLDEEEKPMSALYLNPEQKVLLDAGFEAAFGGAPERYFSAPGRTEISGNHTDHQHGCVLAGAVDL